MSTSYHVYANNGAGGPVDYSAPIATTTALTWTPPTLALGSDWTFAVRPFDTVTGLEDGNVDARVRIAVDGSGNDRASVPGSPRLIGVRATSGGGCRVDFVPSWDQTKPVATSFRVYLTAGTVVDYTTPAATVPYAGRLAHHATLTGLAEGTAYVVAVRAVNAAGADSGAQAVSVVGSNVGPANVDGLTATATHSPDV